MAARKYGISRNYGCDGRWDVRGGQDIEPGVAGFVTAHDARDVGPLVEAARSLVDALDMVEVPAASVLTVAAAVDEAEDALAPFDSEES